MRLQLTPGLPLVSRGPSTVQVGLDARHGTVLDGLTQADLELLEELATGVDEERLALPSDAAPAQLPGLDRLLRARMLVSLLTDTGVLQRSRSGRAALSRLAGLRARLAPDAAAWSLVHAGSGDGWELLAARRRATVELHGGGRTALAMAAALSAAGVGSVRVVDDRTVTAADLTPGGTRPGDVGDRACDVAARMVERALDLPPGDALGPPDIVVLVDRAATDPTAGDRLLAADLPHLSIVIRETSVVVGPLVVPGRGACLRCLDLHRTDRDPQWPMVLAQLLQAATGGRAPREETALAQVAGGVATLQVLGHLDGRGTPACLGATLEVELPDGLVSRRPWPAHPSCGCSWPPAPGHGPRPGTGPDRTRRTRPGQDGRGGPQAATMLS